MKVDTSLALISAPTPKISSEALSGDDLKLKEQTDAFEAFMLKQILDISLKSENKLFGEDPGNKIYQSMYNDTFSKSLSGGMGYSQLLFNYLKENS